MKKPTLIFIYGAPASGKLTTAKELSSVTNTSLFHNHLSFDLAASIYDAWSEEFTKYCEELRVDGIKRAMQANRDLIFTFCYDKGPDDAFVNDVIKTTEDNGGQILFIQLTANEDTVLNRVDKKERKQFLKISDKSFLKEYMNDRDLFSSIEHPNNFCIDSGALTPQESVKSIVAILSEFKQTDASTTVE